MSGLWIENKGSKYLEYTVLIENCKNRIRYLEREIELTNRDIRQMECQIKFCESSMEIYRDERVKIVRLELFSRAKQDIKTDLSKIAKAEQEVRYMSSEVKKLSKEAERLEILRDNSVCAVLRLEDYAKRRKDRY